MPKTELNKVTKVEVEESTSLKGTLVSVFILGFFLIISWAGVYYLFLDRF